MCCCRDVLCSCYLATLSMCLMYVCPAVRMRGALRMLVCTLPVTRQTSSSSSSSSSTDAGMEAWRFVDSLDRKLLLLQQPRTVRTRGASSADAWCRSWTQSSSAALRTSRVQRR